MTAAWLALRYFGSWRRLFNLSTGLSIAGMAIGVASLVVSMAVFSGYVTTLERTVQDAFGHLLIVKRGSTDQGEMMNDIRRMLPNLVATTPFVSSEAILAGGGKISGVLIEGIDATTVGDVLNLGPRLIAGSMDLDGPAAANARALIGKGIAEKFKLGVGDTFRVIVPMAGEYPGSTFRPKLGTFTVAGVVNYGRFDFDSRYVALPLSRLQDFIEIGRRVTGFRVKLDDPFRARDAAAEIGRLTHQKYWARDWLEVNRNLFEAARLEKVVLFFVLMVLVVAAAFNIANMLFISVVQRYRDISVLKTLGAPNAMIARIFTVQGLVVGAVGSSLGIILGLLACRAFEFAQVHYHIIPAEVYKLDHIELRVQPLDLLAILGASLLVCLLATLVPSRRGAKVSPVEGLRYE